jgi:hypothetical protein
MSENTYKVEPYWDNVASHISKREYSNVIAGDDEPYYKYKRKLFLKLFDTIDFSNKKGFRIRIRPWR